MVDQTPLTNADFRKLLSTPRRTDQTPGSTPGGAGRSVKREGSNKPKKPFLKPKPAGQEDEGEAKYRDRAEERRRGINPDYAAANQLLTAFGSQGDVDPSKLSIEDTKYLGGDLEHTHLVKGLDYALLQKTRSSMHTTEDGKEGEAGQQDGEPVQPIMKREDMSITHHVAKGIYEALFVPKRSAVAEHFLPRRTAFVYSLEPDEDGFVQEIPTTLRRSKADCPAPVEAVFAKVDTAVIERIAKIMSYIKTGAGGKKVKKKERDELLGELIRGGAPAAATAAAAGAGQGAAALTAGAAPTKQTAAAANKAAAAGGDDDDNIFDDAGTDYKPSVSGKKKAEQKAAAAGRDDDMDLDTGEGVPPPPPTMLPPPPPPSAHGQAYQQGYGDAYAQQYAAYGQYTDQYGQQWPAQGYGTDAQEWGQQGMPHAVQDAHGAHGTAGAERQASQDDGQPKWRVQRRKAEERQVDFVDDAYGEYYPMAGGFEIPTLEDDEEPANAKAARAAQKQAEAPPKGEKEIEKGRGQKLSNQLQKIEHIFKTQGKDHAAAFGKTPGRTQTGEDPNLALRENKKRRVI